MKRLIYPILFFCLVIFGSIILFYPPTIGLADNSDFGRSIQGIKLDSSLKYFYFQEKFNYTKDIPAFSEQVQSILNQEKVPNTLGYRSTQSLFVKSAQIINSILNFMKYGRDLYFDIRILGLLYLIIYCASLIFLHKVIGSENKIASLILLILLTVIFMADGYLVYFNSFFGEAPILVSFLLYVSSALYLIKSKSFPYWALILYFLSGIVFIGAKVANTPLGLLMALFTGLFFILEKTLKKRLIIVIGICFFLFTSFYYYSRTPQQMKDVTQYHSIFYGVLKNTGNPSQDLKDLGLDEKYVVLANTNGYMDHQGYDIYSEEFRADVYEKTGPIKILLYYVTHPGRFFEKMNLSAEASLPIRPTYLGNYSKTASAEILLFSDRFALWEKFRKSAAGNAFAAIGIIMLIFTSTIMISFLRSLKRKTFKNEFLHISFNFMLLGFAVSQFILPVVGNGEADISKHMFLFNVILDTIIFILLVRLIAWIRQIRIKKESLLWVAGAAASLLIFITIIICIHQSQKVQTLVFGKYQNKPIEWEILMETETSYLLVSKHLIGYRSFDDDNKNLWSDSDIREWLNSTNKGGFLEQLSPEEQKRILSKEMKSIVSPDYSLISTTGNQALFWSCIPGDASQNSKEAFGIIENEKVFLLSIEEWEKYSFDRKKSAPYWLRTPYTNPKIVRVVGTDGYVYHKEANMKNIGVLPAVYISK